MTVYTIFFKSINKTVSLGDIYFSKESIINPLLIYLKENLIKPDEIFINNTDLFYLEKGLLCKSVVVLEEHYIIDNLSLIDNMTLQVSNKIDLAKKMSKKIHLEKMLKLKQITFETIIDDSMLSTDIVYLILIIRALLLDPDVLIIKKYSNIGVSCRLRIKKILEDEFCIKIII